MKRWLTGPEAYWTVWCLVAWVIGRRNLPPTAQGNLWLEHLGGWGLPLLAVPLGFVAVFGLAPGSAESRWVRWGRLAVATALGSGVASGILTAGIDYQDSRNAGTLGVWVQGLLLAAAAFVACSLLLVLVVAAEARRPVAWDWSTVAWSGVSVAAWLLGVFFLIGAAGPSVGLGFAAGSAAAWLGWWLRRQ